MFLSREAAFTLLTNKILSHAPLFFFSLKLFSIAELSSPQQVFFIKDVLTQHSRKSITAADKMNHGSVLLPVSHDSEPACTDIINITFLHVKVSHCVGCCDLRHISKPLRVKLKLPAPDSRCPDDVEVTFHQTFFFLFLTDTLKVLSNSRIYFIRRETPQ